MPKETPSLLNVTTPELWPLNAKRILESKHVQVEPLKKMFQHIVFPWDKEYNTERVYFSLRVEYRPLFIVKPMTTCEIEKILDYVKVKKLTVVVMNGRHSSNLKSGEVMIDMSSFRHKKLVGEILIAGAGNTQGSLNDFLFNQEGREIYSHFGAFTHPRVDTDAFPGGSAATVGCAGISTAGGVGTLCRTYGLTIDSIVSFKITLAPTETRKSRTIVVTKEKHPGLFWALKGGVGSNFGIISEITYTIIEVPSVIEYAIHWEWSQAEQVLRQWTQESLNRPIEFNEDIAVYYNPESKQKGIELSGHYVIPPGQSKKEAIKMIHSQVDSLGGDLTIKPPVPYSHLYKQLVRNRRYFNFSIIQTMFTDIIQPEHIVKYINKADGLQGSISISFTLLGGKITKVPTKSAAFYPRQKHFFVDLAVLWNTMNQGQPIEKWANKTVKELIQVPGTYVYVGFPITFSDIEYPNTIYYGKHYPFLQKIKAYYDPLNIFTYTGTITP